MDVNELYGTFIDENQMGAFGTNGKGNIPDESGISLDDVGLTPVLWLFAVVSLYIAIRLLSDYNN